MKNIVFTILTLFFTNSILAQIPKVAWTKVGGSSGGEIGIAVTTDASENVYTIGIFENTVDFDPGIGVANLSSSGGSTDIFIQKLSKQGNFVWAKRLGGSSFDEVFDVESTFSGNILISGYFQGTVDFDPGSGTFNLSSNGSGDAFILRLDSNGSFKWAISFGANWSDKPYAIKVDDMGNTYVTGYFQNTVDFDPGPGVHNKTANSNRSLFILKLDTNGLFQWVRTYQGYGVNEGSAIELDSRGNIYLTGYFADSVDFDPGPAVNILSTTSINSADVFLQKLNSTGQHIWTRSFGLAYGFGLAVDGFDNIYLLGQFFSPIDFDPGSGTHLVQAPPNNNAFVEKLDSNGNFLWVSTIEGPKSVLTAGISCDSAGNVYVTGNFGGTADFDPGPGVHNISANGSHRQWDDIYLEKLDASGNLIWVYTLGSTGRDMGVDVHQAESGNLYMTGRFMGTFDFDPSPVADIVSSNGGIDFFTQKVYECVPAFSKDIQYACDSLTWLDGITYYTSNSSAQYLISNGASNGCDSTIKLELHIQNTASTIDSLATCDSLVWIDGNTYYENNDTAQFIIQNGASNGCDSIVFLNLEILNSLTLDTKVACDSFKWIDGVTYYSDNNTSIFTLNSAKGCDSVVALDLKINHRISSLDVISTCDSITWINGVTYKTSNSTASHRLAAQTGCDSLVYLDLTVNHSSDYTDSVVACKSYKWIDGNIYYNNMLVTDSLVSPFGCDSIARLHLIIKSVDTVVVHRSGTLRAKARNATFQWFDCTNGLTPIQGETDSIFFPKSNGSYLVVINQNGCVDTSRCLNVMDVGLVSEEIGDGFKTYPNPSNKNVIVEFSSLHGISDIEIYDSQGKVVYRAQHNVTDRLEIDLPDPVGVYTIKLSNETGHKFFMVTKY